MNMNLHAMNRLQSLTADPLFRRGEADSRADHGPDSPI